MENSSINKEDTKNYGRPALHDMILNDPDKNTIEDKKGRHKASQKARAAHPQQGLG